MPEQVNYPELAPLLRRHYGLEAGGIVKARAGAGSDTYFITGESGRYVLKFPEESPMNDPAAEPALCAFLLERGIPACRFLPNLAGELLCRENGRVFHLQRYIEGDCYENHRAPQWLLGEAARLLGRIHKTLCEYPRLKDGIGPDFFRNMTPERALASYRRSLERAQARGDAGVAEDLRYRIGAMGRFPPVSFDIHALTRANTHGDYLASQMICEGESVRAVIDWTTACVHPVVWEILRSFVYASPLCSAGEVDVNGFMDYLAGYLAQFELREADILALPGVFHYQIAVCDYYAQNDFSTAGNRDIFLAQAVFSTRLMRWFEGNGDGFAQALRERFLR